MTKATEAGPQRLLGAIVAGIQEVKGREIVHLDLREVPNTVCDHFVICHGDSSTQVDAIVRSVQEFAQRQADEKPWHMEGERNSEWVLLDFVDVVVHIFHRDKRGFYALEDLWGDAVRNLHENVA